MSTMMKHVTMIAGLALMMAVGSASAVGHGEAVAPGAIASNDVHAIEAIASPSDLRQRCPICNSHCC